MLRKIALILMFSLMMVNVFALEVDQFPENQTETTVGDIAKMKGEILVKIEQETGKTRTYLDTKLAESEERTKLLIEKRTNPFIINMPTIILIIFFGLIWVILKARGKL